MIVYDATVSERYGQALFNVAKRQGHLDAVKADSEQLLKLLERDSKLAVFLEGPQFPTEDKQALLKKLFTADLNSLLMQLLQMLILKGRIEYARPILTRFIALAEQDQGLHQAEVSTATELSDAEKQRVQQGLEGYTKSRLQIHYRVEPALIGGVRFTMGDLMIDDSVKGKLDKLRFRLQGASRQ